MPLLHATRNPLGSTIGDMARHAFQYCEGPLPFPAGESPFHIKGEMHLQTVQSIRYYDAKSNGRVAQILKREGLDRFYSQSFLSSANYDALPLPRSSMAIAEALDRDILDLTNSQGRTAVKVEMTGVYAAFLTNLTPRNFAQMFPKVINHLYDFSPVEASPLPGGEPGARVVRTAMPLCLAEWWITVTTPFVIMPLEQGGAQDVGVDWRIDPSGSQQGVPVGEIEGIVRWRTAPPANPRESGVFQRLKKP